MYAFFRPLQLELPEPIPTCLLDVRVIVEVEVVVSIVFATRNQRYPIFLGIAKFILKLMIPRLVFP